MKRIQFLVCAFIVLASFSIHAETTNQANATNNPTAEQRRKMADLHEKMAACLRSERAISECREEIKKDCKDAVVKEGCPMMEKGMGRGRRSMMDKSGDGKE